MQKENLQTDNICNDMTINPKPRLSSSASLQAGPEFQDKLRSLPKSPGVYLFKGPQGQVIYVGKSVNLRSRVRSYFTPSQKWEKVLHMREFIHDLEVKPTDTHLEARLEECKLIKDIQPHFNKQFKVDARYMYVEFPPNRWPRVISYRSEDTYGPFRSTRLFKDLLKNLRFVYPLSHMDTKHGPRIDLSYQPIAKRLGAGEREETIGILKSAFEHPINAECLIMSVEDKMREAVSDLDFETAAFYRDLLPGLKSIEIHAGVLKDFLESEYLLEFELGEDKKHFYIREGLVLLDSSEDPLDLANFIQEGRDKQAPLIDEKARYDYQDIVYTELKSLQENGGAKIIKLD